MLKSNNFCSLKFNLRFVDCACSQNKKFICAIPEGHGTFMESFVPLKSADAMSGGGNCITEQFVAFPIWTAAINVFILFVKTNLCYNVKEFEFNR